MTIKEKIAARAAALAKGKRLIDTASAEKRELTPTEKADLDAATAQADQLQREIDEAALAATSQPTDAAAAARAAVQQARAHDLDVRKRVRETGLPEEVADDILRRGIEGDAVSTVLIDELAKRSSDAGHGRRIVPGFDMSDPVEIRSSMIDALVSRATERLPQAHRVAMSDRGRSFGHHSLLDMFCDIARARGERIDEHLPAAAKFDRLVQMRALSTSDFPILLADAANKILVKAYELAQPTYRMIFAKKIFTDFKPHKFSRAGDFPNLLEVGEKGEIQYGSMGESKQELTLSSYGRILGLSRRILINDDLNAFADLPMKAARRVADFENATAWAQLALNSGNGPTITETTRALFNTTDGTKAGSNAAISITTVSDGRAAMMKKASIDGMKLNVAPRYLVTSPDKFTVAEQFCSVNIVPAQDSNANPFKGRLTPLADANLTGNGWYLFADPMDLDTLVYGHLEGAEGPRMMSREGFTTDGLELRVDLDFVAGAIDFRGGWLNAGA